MSAEPSILPLRLMGLCYSVDGISLLTDIDLTIPAGRTRMIVGPNGAGKSLLLRLCHGLLMPTKGDISWQSEPKDRRRHAMVFQRPVLLRRSANANLNHALSISGISRPEAKSRVDEAISRFGLEALAAKPARLLSGGEQQRLAIARAWVLKPELLFLDEPTAHLDPGATRIVEQLLGEFLEEGITVVMTTHEIAQVRRLADDVTLLHRGKLIESGSADNFLSNPGTATAKAFLAGELLW